MSLMRVLLAWLIMAAIPVQGLAAVSMAFCQGAHQHAAATHGDGGLDPATIQHDHSMHKHAGEAPQIEVTDADAVSAKALPDASHKCGVCASCCHSLALAQLPQWPVFASAPQVGSAEEVVLIHATSPERPDKPPRA